MRIQRRRTKGWRMPEGAVYVGRPSKWGNPWEIGDVVGADVDSPYRAGAQLNAFLVVELFEAALLTRSSVRVRGLRMTAGLGYTLGEVRRRLAGKDLVCWCGLCPKHTDGKPFEVGCPYCEPCHADSLGRVAAGLLL
jgi:hypothetical protein